MVYCLKCSHKMQLSIPDMDTKQRLTCPSCGYIHYENPKVIVGVLPTIDNKVLLCKRAINPGYGQWTIPAGFLECNETLLDGALREASEEAGIKVHNPQLYALFSIPRISQIYIIYRAEMESKQFNIGPETLEANFFSFEKIPFEDIAFSSIKLLLNLYIEDFKNARFQCHDITL